jgi:hypothetical protein
MGFWDELRDKVLVPAGQVYVANKEVDRILEFGRNVARRELKHSAAERDDDGIQLLINRLDEIAKDTDDERAELAAELAEYAESLLD